MNFFIGWLWRNLGKLGQYLAGGLLAPVLLAAQMPEIDVYALFKNSALVSINGKQHVLRLGGSIQGITLISADSRRAVVAWQGQEFELTLSRQMAGGFQPVEEGSVSIQLNNKGQYVTTGSINNVPVAFLVDTGASIVAMNSAKARQLGLQFETGNPGEAVTAGGRVKSWQIVLDQVQVGAIKRYNVKAAVLEGRFPAETLLGMTFLQQVEISEANGVMVLTSKF